MTTSASPITHLPRPPPNPIGALAAACLGVGQVSTFSGVSVGRAHRTLALGLPMSSASLAPKEQFAGAAHADHSSLHATSPGPRFGYALRSNQWRRHGRGSIRSTIRRERPRGSGPASQVPAPTILPRRFRTMNANSASIRRHALRTVAVTRQLGRRSRTRETPIGGCRRPVTQRVAPKRTRYRSTSSATLS